MDHTRATGTAYEQKAAEYLRGLGYQILAQNFCSRAGEIDLIAKDGEYLVFIEVKYRSSAAMGMPQEAVDGKKQKKICRAAAYYCYQHAISPVQPCRFDVVAYMKGQWTLIQNAFDFMP